jgi:hypothetical protein
MPNCKASHIILVRRCPVVLEIHTWQGVVPGMVAVEGLIAIEQLFFGNLSKSELCGKHGRQTTNPLYTYVSSRFSTRRRSWWICGISRPELSRNVL